MIYYTNHSGENIFLIDKMRGKMGKRRGDRFYT